MPDHGPRTGGEGDRPRCGVLARLMEEPSKMSNQLAKLKLPARYYRNYPPGSPLGHATEELDLALDETVFVLVDVYQVAPVARVLDRGIGCMHGGQVDLFHGGISGWLFACVC